MYDGEQTAIATRHACARFHQALLAYANVQTIPGLCTKLTLKRWQNSQASRRPPSLLLLSPFGRYRLWLWRSGTMPVRVLTSTLVNDLQGEMTLGTILLILLILLLIGAFPSWPYSRSWGYAPSGVLGVVLLVVVVLLLMGRI